MRGDPTTDFRFDANGRKLRDGVVVDVDTAAWDGTPDLGQIIGDEPDEHGIWSYRGIAAHTGREYQGRAANYDMAIIKHESKQTEAARETRRRLRAMGWRIRNSWGDGLVRMEKDGFWLTVRLDGTISNVETQETFDLKCQLIYDDFKFAIYRPILDGA